MNACLSILRHDEPGALSNHRRYAERFGYAHASASVAGLQGTTHAILFKYELILHHLRKLAPGALLACFDEDCAIVGDHPLELVAKGRDAVLTCIVADDEGRALRQSSVQVWRNTEAIREFLVGCIARAKVTQPLAGEEALLAGLEWLPVDARVEGGIYPAIGWHVRSHPRWTGVPQVWAVVLHDVAIYAGTPPAFRQAFFGHIGDWQQGRAGLFDFPSPPAGSPYSAFRPESPIAFVSLHTPNIRNYAAIAESNLARYCERHGYALHIYRDTPADADPGLTGAWLKGWLLRRHLPAHEWVIWIDADILVNDPSVRMEPLFEGRDILAAHDIGPWVLNSGVFGLRRTEANRALVESICSAILAVPDRSSTYASGGDQTVIADRLAAERDWNLSRGTDLVSINTPWYFRQPWSFMVHYYGMVWQARAMLMSAHDREGGGAEVSADTPPAF